MTRSFLSLLVAVGGALQAAAQLSGKVGPLTSRADKAAIKTCNILDYGGVADAKTDNGKAISDAWNDCKTTGGEVYIPEGDYGLSTWLKLSGSAMSFRLDGIIYRIGTDAGNMLFFQHMEDFEFYSSTSKGAIQGYGYEFHKDNTYGPRILRFYDVKGFSIHDVALVDAPAFHFSLDTCSDGEVYNMAIHGGNRGGLDGIDVWSTNIWIHDVEVSNKDECVTVKNPSDHILIENIFCNWSGGCAMGSLAADTDIHDIEYNRVYTQNSNQMYMFKSYGGSGTVSNVALRNFAGHSNAYTLDLDATWSSMKPQAGDGILYSNFTFSGWSGTCANGHQRGPIKFNCPADVPCEGMHVEDFNVWTDEGDFVEYGCKNAYGTGVCLKEGSAAGAFTTTQTVSSVGSYATATMDGEITGGLGLTASIAIPTIRASFFPGVAAISPRMADSAGGAKTAAAKMAAVTASESAAAVPTNGFIGFEISVSSSGAEAATSTAPAVVTAPDAETPTTLASFGPVFTPAPVSASSKPHEAAPISSVAVSGSSSSRRPSSCRRRRRQLNKTKKH